MVQTNPTTPPPDQHRDLFDPQYAAEQRRLGRRRVLFITVMSTIGGILILGSFFLYGWLYGETLPATRKDRFAMVTASDVSEAANNSVSLRLDREKISKHRDRLGVVRLNYHYDDGGLQVECDIEVHPDDFQSRQAYAERSHATLNQLREDGWTLATPGGLGRMAEEDEATYGSLLKEGQSKGHFFVIRIGSKVMRGRIVGHHFDDKGQFSALLTNAIRALGIYNQ